MSHTDLIIDLPLLLEISGVLVELMAILPANAVDDEVVVEVIGVHVGGDYHLELREQPLSQFQTDGVDFLRGDVLRQREGLDELVEHPAIGFPEPPLGGHHFIQGGLGHAVVTSHQPVVFPCGFLLLRRIDQDLVQRAAALGLVFDGGEGSHYRTSLESWLTCSYSFA